MWSGLAVIVRASQRWPVVEIGLRSGGVALRYELLFLDSQNTFLRTYKRKEYLRNLMFFPMPSSEILVLFTLSRSIAIRRFPANFHA